MIPGVGAEFVWRMEGVLDVYARPYDCEQCLDDHIPDGEMLQRKVRAWETARNEQRATVNWRFSTSDARVKLERLYPNLSESSW